MNPPEKHFLFSAALSSFVFVTLSFDVEKNMFLSGIGFFYVYHNMFYECFKTVNPTTVLWHNFL